MSAHSDARIAALTRPALSPAGPVGGRVEPVSTAPCPPATSDLADCWTLVGRMLASMRLSQALAHQGVKVTAETRGDDVAGCVVSIQAPTLDVAEDIADELHLTGPTGLLVREWTGVKFGLRVVLRTPMSRKEIRP